MSTNRTSSPSEIYSHWSREPLELRPDFPYRDGLFKPNGLWFDVNGGWKEWCENEEFQLPALRYRNVLELDAAALLRISNPDEIDAFTTDYRLPGEESRLNLRCIDWQRLRESFKGIVISPYCWQRRLEPRTSWYYVWDCASGCIWDLTAIRKITTEEP